MARFFRKDEIDPAFLGGKRIGVLGYGSQGRAQALNLRDCGQSVLVGGRPGKSWDRAVEDGFSPVTLTEAVTSSDVLLMSLPDVAMRDIFTSEIAPALRAGQTILFVHGFNIRYGLIQAPADIDVVMVSPKAVGPRLRAEFVAGAGAPALIAVHQDSTGQGLQTALSYAWNIGCRDLVMETTFAEETETDLFGEQAILCGGISALIKSSFQTLVEAGYQPEAAYFECVHEIKLIVDLIYQGGLSYLWNSISDTAEWGAHVAAPQVVNPASQEAMRALLRDIQSGAFAQRWVEENDAGQPNLKAAREADAGLELERVGKELRSRMPFIDAK